MAWEEWDNAVDLFPPKAQLQRVGHLKGQGGMRLEWPLNFNEQAVFKGTRHEIRTALQLQWVGRLKGQGHKIGITI